MPRLLKKSDWGCFWCNVSLDREELVRRSFDVVAELGIGLFSPAPDEWHLQPPLGAMPDSRQK